MILSCLRERSKVAVTFKSCVALASYFKVYFLKIEVKLKEVDRDRELHVVFD